MNDDASLNPGADAGRGAQPLASSDERKLAVRVTGDRILCTPPGDADRRTKGGILIPATAKSADRRGVWAAVNEVGPLVRTIESGDRVLFLPDSAIEVDVRGEVFLIVRERDVHAVASGERPAGSTGLYL
ncbi:MAG: co-chaperone GroES [Nitriliruptorales bacterium]|nr:co-chaperone GroES [Nitriliruptorales bacterium]